MKRKILLSILLFLVLFPYCKKGNETTQEEKYFTMQGTVYVDNVPVSDVPVQFSLFGQNWTRTTDADGTYFFSEKTSVRQGFYAAYYAISATNPVTGLWSEPRQGTAPLGTTKTEDFYFFSN